MRKTTLFALLALLSAAFVQAQPLNRAQHPPTVAQQAGSPTLKGSVKSELDRALVLGQRPTAGAYISPLGGIRSPRTKRAATTATNLPRMIGTVIGASNWTDSYTPYGIYDLPLASGDAFSKILDGNGRSAGHLQDGVYFNCKIWMMAAKFGADWSGFDITTGERTFYRETYECEFYSVSTSVDPTSDIVYGLNYTHNGQALQIVTIGFGKDPYGYDEVKITPVGTLEGSWAAIAFDGTGQLWGISFTSEKEGSDMVVTDSHLHKIDKTTGATTLVGATGQKPQYASDMDFDVKTNRLYWSISNANDEGYLTEINTTTGAATRIVDFPNNEEVVGLVTMPTPDPGTPERVSDLSVSFPGGSLSGTATFKTPATNTDGAAGTGTLTYTVLANGLEAGTGTCAYDATVDAPVTVANGGMTTFTVTVANGDKQSKAVKTEAFVGFGTPKATEAKAFWADDFMTVSWTRPTETVDGGFLSPTDPFEYVITDYDTGKTVGKVTDGTSYSFALPEPATRTPYRYKVTGTSNGKSFTSLTNVAYAGAEGTPYANDFNSSASSDGYTIIDANNDGKTWTFDGSTVTCSFNTYMSMDDWLITVPLKLEGGREYPFSIDARCMNVRYSEKLEVKAGTAPTVEAMTIEVLAETVIDKNDMQTYTAMLKAPATGIYYIGVHGISAKDRHTLIIDNLKLDAAMPAAVPSSVQDLRLTPDPTGALTAEVSFITPTTDYQGKPITEINRVEVKLGDALIKTFTAPATGTRLSHPFSVETMGEYTVTVTSFNDEGEGTPNSVTAYIGHDLPAIPEWLTITETAPGVVNLEWDAVTTDIHGTTLPAADITYEIYTVDGGAVSQQPIAAGLTTPSLKGYDLNVPQGRQKFVQFAVYARTPVGGGGGRLSKMIPVGYPSEGFTESFPSGNNSNPLMIAGLVGAPSWMVMMDANGVPCQDNDNGCICMIGEYSYDSGALYTGKFTLAHLTNPTLRFWAYNNYNPDNEDPNNLNTIIVKIAEAGSDDYKTLLSTTFYEIGGTVDGWHKVEVDLSEYKDKVVCMCLETTTASYRLSPFDNFHTYSKVEHNMELAGISAPKRVDAGAEYSVAVTLGNEGYAPATGYTVELYCDGKLLQSKGGTDIPAYEQATIEFPLTMHTLAEEALDFNATVVHTPDMLTDNNASEHITVLPIQSLMPCVTDLAGTRSEGSVQLSWGEPDYHNGTPATVTDDFESYTPWDTEVGSWTLADVDKFPISGFLDFDMPGITPGVTTASFLCFDSNIVPESDRTYYAAHSGHQFMGAINRFDNGTLDDWLISPLLSGNEQVVTFWAKSYSRIFVDAFEMYYSTTGTDVDDFILLAEKTVVPQAWTVYNFDMPRGAKHFAIRAVSQNSFILMVDDITYQSGTEMTPLTLTGYNVWRDGDKLNGSPLTAREFTDTQVPDGSHRYVVTAVYDRGESKASNLYDPTGAGITDPTVKAEVTAVYNSLGIKMAPDANLAPGVYLLEYSDGSVRKSIVR